MKAKKENITIRELFREKLEFTEVTPDQAVRDRLMRRLERKEFLRFNSNRINIYYVGGVLVAGLVALLALSNDPKPDKEIENIPVQNTLPGKTADNTNTASTVLKDFREITKPRISEGIPAVTSKPEEKREQPVKSSVEENTNAGSIQRLDPAGTISTNRLVARENSVINNLKTVPAEPENKILQSLTEGCMPLKVKFTNSVESCDSCRWSFGDGGFSLQNNPEWIYDSDGEFKVVLSVYNKGAVTTSTSVIKVYQNPIARFEISRDDPTQAMNQLKFINYSANAVKFKWSFGDGGTSEFFEPRYTYSKSGTYNVKLLALSEYGCGDSLMILNAFTGNNYFINFPNAFIPNGGGPTGGYYSTTSDEGSQVFHPVFAGISDYQLRIFSKLGILIFESNDISVGWDGYFKGQLSEPGVYIWKVRGTFLNGEQFIKMGDLTLLKTQ